MGQPTPRPAGDTNQSISNDLASFREGFNFRDFVTFRYMITPPLITIIYVLAVIGITLVALASLNTSVLAAIIGWILAMLWLRVIFEVMIILFRINDGIQSMARRR
jgi:hypothetical protein